MSAVLGVELLEDGVVVVVAEPVVPEEEVLGAVVEVVPVVDSEAPAGDVVSVDVAPAPSNCPVAALTCTVLGEMPSKVMLQAG